MDLDPITAIWIILTVVLQGVELSNLKYHGVIFFVPRFFTANPLVQTQSSKAECCKIHFQGILLLFYLVEKHNRDIEESYGILQGLAVSFDCFLSRRQKWIYTIYICFLIPIWSGASNDGEKCESHFRYIHEKDFTDQFQLPLVGM